MPDRIEIVITDGPVQAALDRIAARLADMTPVMELTGEILRSAALDAFERQASPEGRKWPPLSPVTLAMRARRLKAGRTRAGAAAITSSAKALLDTGVLRSSINVGDAGPRSVDVGVLAARGIKYARIHQFGGMAGRNRKVRIPARPYLGISPDAREDILDAVVAWLKDAP